MPFALQEGSLLHAVYLDDALILHCDAHPGAGLGQAAGDDSANTAGGPGDQCYFASQVDTGHRLTLPARAAAGGFGCSVLVHRGQVFSHDVDHAQVHVADGGAYRRQYLVGTA